MQCSPSLQGGDDWEGHHDPTGIVSSTLTSVSRKAMKSVEIFCSDGSFWSNWMRLLPTFHEHTCNNKFWLIDGCRVDRLLFSCNLKAAMLIQFFEAVMFPLHKSTLVWNHDFTFLTDKHLRDAKLPLTVICLPDAWLLHQNYALTWSRQGDGANHEFCRRILDWKNYQCLLSHIFE